MKMNRRQALAAIAGAPALILPKKTLAQDSLPEIAAGPFAGSSEALQAYAIPEWFKDAKFGIFIHWGLVAIPGFAPKLGSIGDAFRLDYDHAVAMTPYTEWYWNAIRTSIKSRVELCDLMDIM